MDVEITEGFAKFSDLFVEQGDLLEIAGEFFAFVEIGLRRFFGVGIVR